MISCQQYFHKTQQNEDDQINEKISTINQLFKQMNLKKALNDDDKSHQRNITSDSIETPIYEVPVKHYEINNTQSDFQQYLQRKQIQREFPSENIQLGIKHNDNEKDEDLLSEVRTIQDKNCKSRQQLIEMPQRNQNCSAKTLKGKVISSQHQQNSQLRNKTEIIAEQHIKHCQQLSTRDVNKVLKNKQIIEQAYETFVEKKMVSKSPGVNQQRKINEIASSFNRKINHLLSITPEKQLKFQATIKKNYFIN